MIPGEIFPADGDITLNAGREAVALSVANTGDRPIQVGSHYHFAETNAALDFDRAAARGRRLDIPAGTAVRFEPGQTREVRLDPLRRSPPRLRLQRQGHGRPRMTAEHPPRLLPLRRRRLRRDRRHLVPDHLQLLALPAARLGPRLRPARELHAAARRGRADRLHLQQRHHPPQVLQDLRHPELLLRRRCPTAPRWWRSTATASRASTRAPCPPALRRPAAERRWRPRPQPGSGSGGMVRR